MEDFRRLLQEMDRQGIKGYSLAKKADINSSDFYSALKGNRPMYPAWRKRISDALGVDERELFKEGDADNE